MTELTHEHRQDHQGERRREGRLCAQRSRARGDLASSEGRPMERSRLPRWCVSLLRAVPSLSLSHRTGARVWTTDVCVPLSKFPHMIEMIKVRPCAALIEALLTCGQNYVDEEGLIAPIVGHGAHLSDFSSSPSSPVQPAMAISMLFCSTRPTQTMPESARPSPGWSSGLKS